MPTTQKQGVMCEVCDQPLDPEMCVTLKIAREPCVRLCSLECCHQLIDELENEDDDTTEDDDDVDEGGGEEDG